MKFDLLGSSAKSTTKDFPTVGKSRFEINFRRLLCVCEEQTANRVRSDENDASDDFPAWRLDKFLETLEGQLVEMRKGAMIEPGTFQDYEKRVKYLRSVCPPYVDSFSSPDDELDIHPPTRPPPAPVVLSSGHFAAPGINRAPENAAGKRIEATIRTTLEENARRELMGDSQPVTGLRNRAKVGLASDVDAIMNAHQEEQDRVAEEMIHLARSLKEQSIAAGRIIAKDKEVLEATNVQADTNFGQLQTETQVLAGYRANACKCWIYVLMFCVCVTFIGMVLFMRLFKKRL